MDLEEAAAGLLLPRVQVESTQEEASVESGPLGQRHRWRSVPVAYAVERPGIRPLGDWLLANLRLVHFGRQYTANPA